MKTIGQKCKEFRESKGWNTTKMARLVGTTRTSIENMEKKGDYRPRFIVELATVMGVSVDYLLNDEQGPSETIREPQWVSNSYAEQLAKLFMAIPPENQQAAFTAAMPVLIGFLKPHESK